VQQTGKFLIITGIIIIVAGILIYLAGDKLGWIGRLPGDIRVEKENVRFYFPITSMLLLSAVLSFLIWLFRKLF
jgi:hypothetical protein